MERTDETASADEKVNAETDEEPSDYTTFYEAGRVAGRQEAWAEALHLAKGATANAFLGEEERTARALRELCHEMVKQAYRGQDKAPSL